METVNKDKMILDWIGTCSYLTDTPLFSYLTEKGGAVSVMQVPGEAAAKSFIDGSAEKHYDFMIQVMLPISDTTDSVNTDNMLTQRQWQDWIDDQEVEGNYPDFGARCSAYELMNLASGPQLAQTYTEAMATYQFAGRLIYLEERNG